MFLHSCLFVVICVTGFYVFGISKNDWLYLIFFIQFKISFLLIRLPWYKLPDGIRKSIIGVG
jgi:hypothetical protein